ncbi:NAD-dependent epimerase/dehydratase family protein [Kitasatospora sp. NPDC054795]
MADVYLDPRLREPTGAGVLVTGGGGLVGSRIARLTALGANPIVLDRFDAYPHLVRGLFRVGRHGAQVVLGDVRERATVKWLAGRADYVIHAAAFVDMPRSGGDPRGGCADTRRATDLLGRRPAVTLTEGIDRYVNWLRTTPDAVPDWFATPATPAASLAA